MTFDHLPHLVFGETPQRSCSASTPASLPFAIKAAILFDSLLIFSRDNLSFVTALPPMQPVL